MEMEHHPQAGDRDEGSEESVDEGGCAGEFGIMKLRRFAKLKRRMHQDIEGFEYCVGRHSSRNP